MITAVDSSVLLDILTDDPGRRPEAVAALRDAQQVGRVLICPVVWAEIRAFCDDGAVMAQALGDADLRFDPFDQECADVAGALWREYRRRGGQRTRVMADFLIGAHAQVRGGRLLTRDCGFFRRYFAKLQILGTWAREAPKTSGAHLSCQPCAPRGDVPNSRGRRSPCRAESLDEGLS